VLTASSYTKCIDVNNFKLLTVVNIIVYVNALAIAVGHVRSKRSIDMRDKHEQLKHDRGIVISNNCTCPQPRQVSSTDFQDGGCKPEVVFFRLRVFRVEFNVFK